MNLNYRAHRTVVLLSTDRFIFIACLNQFPVHGSHNHFMILPTVYHKDTVQIPIDCHQTDWSGECPHKYCDFDFGLKPVLHGTYGQNNLSFQTALISFQQDPSVCAPDHT